MRYLLASLLALAACSTTENQHPQASAGATQGGGGATQATGGVTPGRGGATQTNGGAQQGGGGTAGTSGASPGEGGMEQGTSGEGGMEAGTSGAAGSAGGSDVSSRPDPIAPTVHEASAAAAWIDNHLGSAASARPFSFTYGDASSNVLLAEWPSEYLVEPLDQKRVQRTLTYQDPQTGLEVRCVIVEYQDFPVVEWTLYFTNQGSSDTPILADLQAIDAELPGTPHENVLLHYNIGSTGTRDDYQPLEKTLAPNTSLQLGSLGGRGSDSIWPYFNLESPQQSVIAAVGWPGQWAATFAVDGAGALRMRAGQELVHLTLRPGEQVRSPLIALLFHDGDWRRSQNIWRRWMIAHNVPRPGGKLPEPIIAAASDVWTNLMQEATEENQKQFIDGFVDRGVPINTWWMDAGWHQGGRVAWSFVGTWEVDLGRFPNGLRAVTDYARQRGLRSVLWFEPERVYTGTWLFVNRSQWLLGSDTTRLFDLGNPEARQWMTDRFDQILTEAL
jgi:alpha-galactosidase